MTDQTSSGNPTGIGQCEYWLERYLDDEDRSTLSRV